MQNKGLIRLFAILFGLVSIYQLSFTFITNKAEDDAKAYAEQKISSDVENYADLRHKAVSHYLDSVENKSIYAGVTYKTAKGKQLNKGLDLKGGISVILQISVNDLLRELSNHSTDPAFEKALAQADEDLKSSQDTYLELFFKAFEKIPDAKLASPDIFGNKKMSGDVTFEMSNDQVEKVLSRRVDESITSAFEVLRKRVDKFGVAQPNIQRLGNSGQILIELPGAQDIERAKNLLQSTAQLEFWHVYQSKDFSQFFQKADAAIANAYHKSSKKGEKEKTETKKDTTQTANDSTAVAHNDIVKDSTNVEADTTADDEADIEALLSSDEKDAPEETKGKKLDEDHPLLSLMLGKGPESGPVLAYFYAQDTAKVNKMLKTPQVRSILPSDKRYARFAWGIPDEKTNQVELYAIKSNKRNIADLTGGVVTDAKQTYDQYSAPAVSLEMDGKGAKIWEKMTGIAYKDHTQIAIVLDNTVYSAPGVTTGAISGGRSEITGNFGLNEAKDLATVLKAGKLPAKTDIVQIEVVGPSLGDEAIHDGIMSFIIALIVVLAFMYFYYGKAGLFADIALLVNLLFIFGILAGLNAVLTLPGIAGIVLTMGMSVDANVLIFERSREELRNGKSQAAAIRDGFKEALSSIIDANVTTFLAGLILLIFGTGPVQGFATTLLIGIITSLFTAIFVAHLFIDNYRTNGKALNFSTPITKDWFSNVNIDFIGKKKIVYIISGTLIIVSIIGFFTRGLNEGVDFVGGRSYTVRFDHEVDASKIDNNLIETFGSAEAKIYGPSNQLKITTKYKVDETGEKVEDEIKHMLFTSLQPQFPKDFTYKEFESSSSDKNIGIMSSIKVGPSIADDIKTAAVWSLLAAFAGIFLYILLRFRKWQFSLGAVIALLHDSIILIGVFSLLRGYLPFSMEVGQDFIAGILTVVGYSINDTVVVFDRIREYFGWHPKWGIRRNVNESISSTIGRTVNTALATLLVLIAIFLFGGESIRSFMFCIMVGVIVGTYSSIFVASPIMYDCLKSQGDNILEIEASKKAAKKKHQSAIKK